jgi:hypothetical protein
MITFTRLRGSRAMASCLVVAVMLTGCGDSGSPPAGGAGVDTTTVGCGPAESERLDPASGRHVLPGAPEPVYATNPPTSGAHQPGVVPAGSLDVTLSKPVQVGALEAGQVIVHWRDLNPGELAALTTALVGNSHVVIMPNPSIGPDRVVATAWLHRMRCSQPDIGPLQGFIAQTGGHGSDHSG